MVTSDDPQACLTLGLFLTASLESLVFLTVVLGSLAHLSPLALRLASLKMAGAAGVGCRSSRLSNALAVWVVGDAPRS